ncbi:hypothetical protein L9F63_018713, partial [Diploptera punctata]
STIIRSKLKLLYSHSTVHCISIISSLSSTAVMLFLQEETTKKRHNTGSPHTCGRIAAPA